MKPLFLPRFLRATRGIALLLVVCLFTGPMAWSATFQMPVSRYGHNFSLYQQSGSSLSGMGMVPGNIYWLFRV